MALRRESTTFSYFFLLLFYLFFLIFFHQHFDGINSFGLATREYHQNMVLILFVYFLHFFYIVCFTSTSRGSSRSAFRRERTSSAGSLAVIPIAALCVGVC